MPSRYLLATVVTLLVCGIGLAREKNQPAPVSETVIRLGTPGAEEVARALACEAYSFEYSGGPILCWLEVVERGQKTLSQEWGTNLRKNRSPGGKGKLIVLIPASFHVSDTFHRFILSYQDDAGVSCLPVEVPEKALWRRPWAVYGTRISCPLKGKSLSPEPGQEFTLLTIAVEEGAEAGRQVKVTLKAKLVERAAR